MSVTLKLKHMEGLVLRQQMARHVDRTDSGTIIKGTEWVFEREPVKQDEDLRKVEADGSHVKLGTYTVYVTAGLKNMVVEKPGKIEHVDFRNSSLRNQLRLKYQKKADVNSGKKDAKPHLEWRDEGAPQYIAPNVWTGVFVGDGQRVIVDEMPT